jgi:hypothetical protein
MFTGKLVRHKLNVDGDTPDEDLVGRNFTLWDKTWNVVTLKLIGYHMYFYCEEVRIKPNYLWRGE